LKHFTCAGCEVAIVRGNLQQVTKGSMASMVHYQRYIKLGRHCPERTKEKGSSSWWGQQQSPEQGVNNIGHCALLGFVKRCWHLGVEDVCGPAFLLLRINLEFTAVCLEKKFAKQVNINNSS
jgi:hypothetical protein